MIRQVKGISVVKGYDTEGHHPLIVNCDDSEQYVIKQDQGKEPPLYIIAEFLGALFLQKWALPVPDFASVTMCLDLLDDEPFVSDPNHLAKYYRNRHCFGSKRISPVVNFHAIFQGGGKDFYEIL